MIATDKPWIAIESKAQIEQYVTQTRAEMAECCRRRTVFEQEHRELKPSLGFLSQCDERTRDAFNPMHGSPLDVDSSRVLPDDLARVVVFFAAYTRWTAKACTDEQWTLLSGESTRAQSVALAAGPGADKRALLLECLAIFEELERIWRERQEEHNRAVTAYKRFKAAADQHEKSKQPVCGH